MLTRLLWILAGFCLTATAAEALLHLFPVSTGTRIQQVNAANPIMRGTPRFHYTYSKDWNFRLANSGVLNNMGFRSSYDYTPDADAIAVLGNSYVQADAILPPDTLTERLGRATHRPAYAIGADGFSLADYLVAARWANEQFHARTLLVILTNGDLNHTCIPRGGQHHLKFRDGEVSMAVIERGSPSRAHQLLDESRLFRYLYDNVRIGENLRQRDRRAAADDKPAEETSTVTNNGKPLSATPATAAATTGERPRTESLTVAAVARGCAGPEFLDAASAFILSSFHELEKNGGAKVLFLVAPGYRTDQNIPAGAVRDIDVFAQRAAGDGFGIVRMDAEFAAALGAGERLDFLPVDGHWNNRAQQIAATVVEGILGKDNPEHVH